MKKILEILKQSNLGWIEGTFSSDCTWEDIHDSCKECVKGKEEGFAQFIFEYEGKVIALPRINFTKEAFHGDKPLIFLTDDGIQLTDKYGFDIDLFFFQNDYLAGGTFRAYLPYEERNDWLLESISAKNPEMIPETIS